MRRFGKATFPWVAVWRDRGPHNSEGTELVSGPNQADRESSKVAQTVSSRCAAEPKARRSGRLHDLSAWTENLKYLNVRNGLDYLENAPSTRLTPAVPLGTTTTFKPGLGGRRWSTKFSPTPSLQGFVQQIQIIMDGRRPRSVTKHRASRAADSRHLRAADGENYINFMLFRPGTNLATVPRPAA